MDEKVEVSSKHKTELNTTSSSGNSKGILTFLIIAIVIIAVVAGIFIALRGSGTNEIESPEEEDNQVFTPIADYTVVYGFWEGENSKINAANLANGNIYEVASLPFNIKKVSITSPTSVIFINSTDVKDHGKNISSYNTSTGQTELLVSASDNFGIDDYQISPNKRYLATWEVLIPPDSSLEQGRSRVYAVDLQNPTVKNLIYDENLAQTTYAHYPVAITDTGEVFMDTFRPNTNAGWANGMTYSDFQGINIQDLPQMIGGTYGTQPKLSPDGRYLAFAGYDGTLGDGNEVINGFRRAILTPNTVETVDVATKVRTKLPNVSSQNIYPEVSWDPVSGNIFYTSLTRTSTQQTGQYMYDLALSSPTQVDTGEFTVGKNTYSVLSSLSGDDYLAGLYTDTETTLGNLGNMYSQAISVMGVFQAGRDFVEPISLNSDLVQFIGVYPQEYFTSTKEVGKTKLTQTDQNQLQLQTFVIKPTLAPVRINQQGLPKCKDLAVDQCNAILGTNYSPSDFPREQGDPFTECYTQQRRSAGDGVCYDSPLYLYGEGGQSVEVKIGTPIYSSNAPYEESYKGILTGTGGIEVEGVAYESLDFDYKSALRRLPRLDYGKTVRSSDVSDVIKEYGEKLGLNSKEIGDLIKKVGTPSDKYTFVSFYSEEVSKSILPISISPRPDVYRNIVFYLKPTDSPIVAEAPDFGQYPQRRGFTAVEVSYILDN